MPKGNANRPDLKVPHRASSREIRGFKVLLLTARGWLSVCRQTGWLARVLRPGFAHGFTIPRIQTHATQEDRTEDKTDWESYGSGSMSD